ncbi:hypothetical protein MGK_05150 [Candida albicans P57055]|nr:hypothetical protein MGK_05150 [Candida albicans P57055]
MSKPSAIKKSKASVIKPSANSKSKTPKIETPKLQQVETRLGGEVPTTKVSIKRNSITTESVKASEDKSTPQSTSIPAAAVAKSNPNTNAEPAKIPNEKLLKTESPSSQKQNGATTTKEKSDVSLETKSTSSTTVSNNNSVLQYTELSEIPIGVERITKAFHSGKTHSLQFRLKQLRNLYFTMKDNQEALCDALQKDFHRLPSETRNYEFATGLNELVFIMSQLHKWSKPQPVDELPLNLSLNPVYIERIPLGIILVIAAFNYPFFVSISPIVGAIASGNTVALKPSELTPRFSKLFTDLLSKALDPEIFFVVNGAIPETTCLLEQKFDKIVYTGSGLVGTIIAKKAAETLTPVILELGGKSPAFVLDDISDKDLATVARRIAWGRFVNAGQTCIGVDYVLVAKSKHDKFISVLQEVIEKEFFQDVDKTRNFTHMIHDRAFEKMESILNTTSGNVIIGGKLDRGTRYVGPTVIDNVTWTDSSMKDEIFGPILPILTYTDLEKSCREIIANHDTPLAQYIFTSGPTSRQYNSQINTITTLVRSGGLVINDVLMHIALHNAPFGGVGTSGNGAYHGEFSYRAFTHERTVLEQHLWNDWVLKSRYPPYANKKDKLIASSQQKYGGRVWFNREGNVRIGGPPLLFSAWNNALGVAELVRDFIGAGL